MVLVNSDGVETADIDNISPLSEPIVARIRVQTSNFVTTSLGNESKLRTARSLDIPPSLEGVPIPVHASKSLFEGDYDSDGLMLVNYNMDRELKELEKYNSTAVSLEGVGNAELVTVIVEVKGGD